MSIDDIKYALRIAAGDGPDSAPGSTSGEARDKLAAGHADTAVAALLAVQRLLKDQHLAWQAFEAAVARARSAQQVPG